MFAGAAREAVFSNPEVVRKVNADFVPVALKAHLVIEGRSEVTGASSPGEGGDGRLWAHEVKLVWDGFMEMEGGRMTRFLLLAQGSERLRWGNRLLELKGEPAVAHLPAGRAIDLECAVRYGIVGEPVLPGEAAKPAPPTPRRSTTGAPRPWVLRVYVSSCSAGRSQDGLLE